MSYPLLYALSCDKNGNLAHHNFAAWFLLQMKYKAADTTLEQCFQRNSRTYAKKIRSSSESELIKNNKKQSEIYTT